MLLQDITKIIRVLLVAFDAVASQDELTQRRIGQIGEVIGAVEDVAEREATIKNDGAALAARRVDEAHDIIHRIAAILAMEDGGSMDGEEAGRNENESDAGSGGSGDENSGSGGGLMVARETMAPYGINAGGGIAAENGGFRGELQRIPWDGKLDDSMIMLLEDGDEDE